MKSLFLTLSIMLLLFIAGMGCTPKSKPQDDARVGAGVIKKRVEQVDKLLSIGSKGIEQLALELDGSIKAAEFLAKHWANCNKPVKRDDYDRYPLHIAAKNGWKDTTALLLSKDADTMVKDLLGFTPLHYAAERGHKETVALLIKKGTDVKARDNLGKIPLHYAAVQGHKDIAVLLIENGADVNAKDNEGETPLDFVGYANIILGRDNPARNEMQSLLRAHGAKTGEELKRSTEYKVPSTEKREKK